MSFMHRTNFSLPLLLLLAPLLIAVAPSSYYSNGNEGEGSTAGSLASPTYGQKNLKTYIFCHLIFELLYIKLNKGVNKNHCVRNAERPVIKMVVVRLVVTVTKTMKTKL